MRRSSFLTLFQIHILVTSGHLKGSSVTSPVHNTPESNFLSLIQTLCSKTCTQNQRHFIASARYLRLYRLKQLQSFDPPHIPPQTYPSTKAPNQTTTLKCRVLSDYKNLTRLGKFLRCLSPKTGLSAVVVKYYTL